MIRFYCLFSYDESLRSDKALLKSIKWTVFINGVLNHHLIKIQLYNINIKLFSYMGILMFVVEKVIESMQNNGDKNNDNKKVTSSFFINPKGSWKNVMTFFCDDFLDGAVAAFRGSSHLYFCLQPRFEVYFMNGNIQHKDNKKKRKK